MLALPPCPPVDAFVTADRLGESQPNFPLDLFLCLKCGHAQLLDVVSPDILFGSYIYVTSSSPGLVEHFRSYAEELLGWLQPPAGALAVDIGSNDGTLLRFFKDASLRVVGVDPALEIGRRATAQGIETRTAFFGPEIAKQVREERGSATIVTANNVFAHTDDLGAMADGVRSLLADDGVFVFEVSYLLDMIDGMIFDLIYHEHLDYHSVKPLMSFLSSRGLELIDVRRNASKGGTLRCIAQLAGAGRPTSPTLARMIAHEDAVGLHRVETYSRWAERIALVGSKVNGMIRDLRAQGKTIAGYGASATGTVLTYTFGLADFIDFIVDDVPERQGRFSPGHHIPVVGANRIYEDRPDYVIVLAWRFADMIISKHSGYTNSGGRFIVPLPEPKFR